MGLPHPECQGVMSWGSVSYAASGGQGEEAGKESRLFIDKQ